MPHTVLSLFCLKNTLCCLLLNCQTILQHFVCINRLSREIDGVSLVLLKISKPMN
ncbi:hypothetical protein MANES_08G075974v8 [Manihot esculenta]|uniref:Uncharacterized protein n=1 Tax=Manihot esculenta TaxID=3983 RepID=A0ACB7HE87_MANES|nr:hypothetical protein MANES_08G075974v8 [Manihot esculenta]